MQEIKPLTDRIRMIGQRLVCLVIAAFATFSSPCQAQEVVNVLTFHNSNDRTGRNLNEVVLNTSNVNVSGFGKLFSVGA